MKKRLESVERRFPDPVFFVLEKMQEAGYNKRTQTATYFLTFMVVILSNTFTLQIIIFALFFILADKRKSTVGLK